jgi:hypothetical protein
VTRRVWGHWGGWAMSCVLGQAAAAVVGCCPWCVVGCGASCDVLAVGVWVGVAVIVMGWGSVTWGLGGVSGSMAGAQTMDLVGLPPVVSPLLSVAPQLRLTSFK